MNNKLAIQANTYKHYAALQGSMLKRQAVYAALRWLFAELRRRLPGFQSRYCKQIRYEHGVFNVRGLRTIGTFTLNLNQVFVPLKIAPSTSPNQPNLNPLVVKALVGNRSIWEFLRLRPLHTESPKVLAIIGPPGCGKTTLLQHVAFTLACNHQHHYQLQPGLPLLLFLRQHIPNIVQHKLTLAELAQQHFSQSHCYPDLDPPAHWFKQQLRWGKCIVLLDGLDEVAVPNQRQAVAQWVDQQITHYPRCQFVVTSRPQGYLSAPLQQAHLLEVQAFSSEQVKQFIHAWYLATEMVSAGNQADIGVTQRARAGAEELLNRLRQLSRLSALTANPLLLTMLTMVHYYQGQLPQRRVELYARICDVLLGHWREAKGIQMSLSIAQKRAILQPLAAWMMLNRIKEVRVADVAQLLDPVLQRIGLASENVPHFLSDIQAHSGLLLETEVGTWRFAHLTFQEYLAANHLIEKPFKLAWDKRVNESWWQETLLLYAAQTNASHLVRTCLKANSVAALTLAADCLEEARELDNGLRVELIRRLIDDLEVADPKRRALAAEVRLRQRLYRLQRIDDETEIDLSFITHAEYQLFVNEMRLQGEYRQPDHWVTCQFPAGCAQHAVGGLRAEDAEAFCRWLTDRQGGDVLYRIPSLAEVQANPALRKTMVSYGVTDDQDYQLHGLDAKTERAILVKIEQYMHTDLPILLKDLDECFHSPDAFEVQLRELDITYAFAQSLEATDVKFCHALDSVFYHAFSLAFERDLSLYSEQPTMYADPHRAEQLLAQEQLIKTLLLELKLAIELARSLDTKVLQALSYAHSHTLILKNLFNRYLTRDLDLTQNIDLVSEFEDLYPEIKQQLYEAQNHSRFLMQGETDFYIKRIATLVYELIGCIELEGNQIEKRHAWRTYLAHLAENLWMGYNSLERANPTAQTYKAHKNVILNLYWWLQIIIAREAGKLRAWEGLRIVRTRQS